MKIPGKLAASRHPNNNVSRARKLRGGIKHNASGVKFLQI
jgi:hypothetical protein